MVLNNLPLFPLGSVLYPGSVLPLRIFEVRYLDMIRRCIENGAPFGIVSLTQGEEVSRPDQSEAFAQDRKSTRLNSSHDLASRMPSSA